MMEGSGSVSLTNGSRSGKPKNLRIRIRNTENNSLKFFVFSGAGEMLRDVREGLLQVPPRGIRREGHLRVRVALHQQDPQLEEDQALLLLGHAGSRDHCAQGCAPAAHQNTLRIQGGFFLNNCVCTGKVPDPTSLFLPTSFCM
jgi:hypothetical protein